MTAILLVLVLATLVATTFTAWALLRIGQRVMNIELHLHRKGLQMCYRDAEDLQRRFARREDTPCD